MAFRLVDRVRETTISPGTGTATLAGAALGYQTFSAGVGASNTTYYVIADQSGANWEVGYGTVGAGGTTLARTTVLSSSNAGALVNFSSGTQDVWVDYPATKAVWLDINGDISQAIRNISGITGAITSPESITFDTAPAIIPTATGSIFWDAGNKTPSVVLDADVTLQLGQENVALVYNGTGSTITNGSVVAVNGAQGQRPSVALADADSEALSAPTLGIATEDIANGAEGFVTTFGFVRGINTAAFTAGLPIYLSQTAGQFTQTRPAAPAHTVALGWVIKVNASSGEVFVNINNGWEIGELHDVLISSPTGGQLLAYDQTNSYWKNISLGAGTGFAATAGTGGTLSIGASVAAIGTWMGTPSSANLLAAMTDETGTGSLVFNTSPTFITPLLGTPTSGTLTNCTGLPNAGLVNSSVTFNGVSVALGASGTITAANPNALTIGTGLSGTSYNGSAAVTIANTGVLSFSGGTTGLTPSTATTGAITLAGTLAVANGGTGATTAPNALINLGGTTVGINFFDLTNPSAITFPRINADNTVSALDAATFRTAIGAGTSSTTGTVTSVGGTGTVSGLTLTGTVTTSGSLTLGGTLAVTASNFSSQTANTFLAAPNGVAGVPTFRSIVAADIPTLNQNTTGTAGGLTGTPNITVGTVNGTNITASGSLLFGTGGSYAAGSIYSDSNYGVIFRSKQASPTTSEMLWANSAGTGLMSLSTAGVLTAASFSGAGTGLTGTASSLSIGGSAASITGTYSGTLTSGQITTGLGFTPYNATNPSSYIALASAITGYTAGTNTALAATDTLLAALGKLQGQVTARTSNTGTVTSVATSGSVNGLTLSGGTITTTGTITLGGSVTSVASGATGATQGVGTNNTTLATTAFINNASIGRAGIVWNSVGRSSGTTYTNTTGHPLAVQVQANGISSANSYIQISVNGGAAVYIGFGNNTISYMGAQGGSVVPIGATYIYYFTNVTAVNVWELY